MSKELRYNCSLVGIITETTLAHLTTLHNLTLTEVQAKVDTIVDLIANKGLTQTQSSEYRQFLNPAHIGIHSDGTVKKRKYVRKNQPVDSEEGITINDLKDIKINTVIISDRITKTGSKYKISKITSTRIGISSLGNNFILAEYTYNDFYSKFKDFRWGFETPTENQITFFKKCNNVIRADKFKTEGGEYKIQFPSNSYFTVIPNPTHNCQLCVLGYGQVLICNSTDILEQLKEVSRAAGKYLILMDIRSEYLKNLKSILGEDFTKKSYIKSHTPYLSTNGSNMNLLMFNTKNL